MMVSGLEAHVRGTWVTASAKNRVYGQAYFAVQAVAGALWWAGVAKIDAVRDATLGEIPALPMAALDLPLFVIASALAAFGVRWAMHVAAVWTLCVAVGMVAYSTLTGLAGWGALMMVLAGMGGAAAWLLVTYGMIPVSSVLRGSFGFRVAKRAAPTQHLARTLTQTLGFWVLFLAVVPGVIASCEARWGLRIELPAAARIAGWGLLVLASGLGIWAGVTMSLRGSGTPLPSASAASLVVDGPYRFVRNPMAVAGIAQAVGVGLGVSSWLVVGYALCGAVYWNWLVRPYEEADLRLRLGAEFERYCDRVRCWWPRLSWARMSGR